MAQAHAGARATDARVSDWLRGSLRGAIRRRAGVRRRLRHLQTRLRSVQYRWLARAGVEADMIVFESLGGRGYAGSPRAVYEAMLTDERFATARFVWTMRDPAHAAEFAALQDPRTTIVRFRSWAYYRAFARARVWVSNSTLLPELVPRHQLYVQTWHGVGIKKIGYDVPATGTDALDTKSEIEERYRVEAPKIGLFVSPAPFGTGVFSSAFRLPASGAGSPFVEVGSPCNDALATATEAQIAAARARLGLADGVRSVLYAPTFRDDDHDPRAGYVADPSDHLEALADALGPDHVLLYRRHYLAAGRPCGDGRVRDVSAIDDPNELLLASDVLVTDYSSLCSEFVLLDRPMVFYVYDADRYAPLRGFYFPIEELPGPLVRTPDELVAALLDPTLADRYAAQRRAFRARMCPHDDGHVSARVLDLIAAGRIHPDAVTARRPAVSASRPVSRPGLMRKLR